MCRCSTSSSSRNSSSRSRCSNRCSSSTSSTSSNSSSSSNRSTSRSSFICCIYNRSDLVCYAVIAIWICNNFFGWICRFICVRNACEIYSTHKCVPLVTRIFHARHSKSAKVSHAPVFRMWKSLTLWVCRINHNLCGHVRFRFRFVLGLFRSRKESTTLFCPFVAS